MDTFVITMGRKLVGLVRLRLLASVQTHGKGDFHFPGEGEASVGQRDRSPRIPLHFSAMLIYVTSAALLPGTTRDTLLLYGRNRAREPVLVEVDELEWTLYMRWGDLVQSRHLLEAACSELHVEPVAKRAVADGETCRVHLAKLRVESHGARTTLQAVLARLQLDTFTDCCLAELSCHSHALAAAGLQAVYQWYDVPLPRSGTWLGREKEEHLHCSAAAVRAVDPVAAGNTPPLRTVYLTMTFSGAPTDEFGHPVEKRPGTDAGPKSLQRTKSVCVKDESGRVSLFHVGSHRQTHGTSHVQSFREEKDMLLAATHHIRTRDADLLIVADLEREFLPLCERLAANGMQGDLHALLSKDSRVWPEVASAAEVALRHRSASRQGESSDRPRAPGRGFVRAFGMAVISPNVVTRAGNGDCPPVPPDAVRSLQQLVASTTEAGYPEMFLQMVHHAGVNSVAHDGKGGIAMSLGGVYNIGYAKILRELGMAVKIGTRKDADPVRGGLVLESVPKYTFDPVVVLDFHSMYPSIVRTFNICASTIVKDEGQVPCFRLPVLPAGHVISCREIGVLPQMVNRWMDVRRRAKDAGSSAEQKAAKICLVNVVGQNMASRGTNPFCSRRVANVVTAVGRQLLQVLNSHTPLFTDDFLSGPAETLYGVSFSLSPSFQEHWPSALDLPHFSPPPVAWFFCQRLISSTCLAGHRQHHGAASGWRISEAADVSGSPGKLPRDGSWSPWSSRLREILER